MSTLDQPISSNSGETKFYKGQRVSLKQTVTQRGRIDTILPLHGGHQFYDVFWDNGTLETQAEHELVPEVLNQSPWDLLAANSLNDYRDFSIATTFHKVRNTTSNTISTLQASRTIFMPYQYKPLVKFLNSDLKRILIADEVGLGKTIEAGHIMLELAARGNLRNALVICTNSLRDKWKAELQEKFNFIMKKYNNPKDFIQDVQNDIAGSKKSVLGILNYEKCRNEELQRLFEESNYSFDLLICDEAHKIRNSETLQHRAVARIVDRSEAVIFLTATPIMTDIHNLHNLIRVLDRQGYDTFDIFNNAVRQNRPFIRAVRQLNANAPLAEIAHELHNTEVLQEMTADKEVYHRAHFSIGELFENDGLYQRTRENMLNKEDSIGNRVQIQQDLIELNSLNHLYTRTRKKDVMSEEDVVTRDPKTISVSLSEEEQEIYNSVIDEYDEENNLGLIQKKRQVSSCIIAYRTPREELEEGCYNSGIPDAKFEAFEIIIQEVVLRKKKKLIVFAFFTNTLLYLRVRLAEMGIGTELIYGAIKDRTARIERFENDGNINVLLSSEVGSEGLDLQFCDTIVNYDLPWNPMVVEQRIGRIDRVGQESPIIHIYNLIIKDTIEERIHQRLYERINLFRESIGDMEEILGETEPLGELVSKGIEALYKTQLTPEQQNQRLDTIRLAIENERQTLQKVQSGLQDAFANDLHFQNEIENITKNRRYLTKEEIIKYLESIIRLNLSSLSLQHLDENISEIELPSNNKNILFDFIEQYKDAADISPELESLYRKFKNKHQGSRKLSLTFDQKYASKHKPVEYISAFHPLVNAITNFFAQSGFDKNRCHKVAVNREHFNTGQEVFPGYYILAIYRVTIKKDYGNGKGAKELHLIKSVVADLNGDYVRVLDSETSEHINSIVQLNGEQLLEDIPLNSEAIQEIRGPISMEMRLTKEAIEKDEGIKFYSAIRRRTEQEVNYIDKRIQRLQGMLSYGIVPILLNEIEGLQEQKDTLLKSQERANIHVNQTPISINLLKVL